LQSVSKCKYHINQLTDIYTTTTKTDLTYAKHRKSEAANNRKDVYSRAVYTYVLFQSLIW